MYNFVNKNTRPFAYYYYHYYLQFCVKALTSLCGNTVDSLRCSQVDYTLQAHATVKHY